MNPKKRCKNFANGSITPLVRLVKGKMHAKNTPYDKPHGEAFPAIMRN